MSNFFLRGVYDLDDNDVKGSGIVIRRDCNTEVGNLTLFHCLYSAGLTQGLAQGLYYSFESVYDRLERVVSLLLEKEDTEEWKTKARGEGM